MTCIKTTRPSTAGFTLIEALASITLLVMAISGPMVLSAQSLRVSREARLQLEATQLAEEGIEIVHSLRDDNSADGTPWMTDILSECSNPAQPCIADITEHSGLSSTAWHHNALKSCASACASLASLYKHNVSGIYRQKTSGFGAGWTKSDFTRLITLTEVVAGREVKVTSTVTYKGYSGQTRTITVTGDLYNWFPDLH
ncbi:MAG: hypothetical protein A3C14_04525 [Candidatus Lloydbacteria bacterium RIFCSPHIGHO2_02_FULL_50_18]|nr:MAG: hypothetical protein A3C14_04525 [Candidatus Lloydbacteria bacterium RIFCSPHIGHO2_02_FULL_50_18]